jgi:uncharacterized protein (TIGR02444 family)
MAPKRSGNAAAAAFWRFSLNFYSRPGVADALIALQDKAGRDVNLILFGLWLGLSGRGRLDVAALAAAELATRKLRAEIVIPLRQLRRRLPASAEDDIRRLREAVKRLELAAERAAQRRLAARAGPVARAADPGRRRADAQANLALCLGTHASKRLEALALHRAVADYAGHE